MSEAIVSTLSRRSPSSIEHPRAYLMQAVLNTPPISWTTDGS